MKPKLTAYLLLILATGLWGIGGPIIKYSFNYTTPFEFLLWRFVAVSLISTPIFIWYLRKNPIAPRDIPKVIALGFFGSILNLALSFVALDKTSVIEVTIIGSLNPMLVALAGSLFLGENIGKGKKIGIALAIAGSVVAVANPLLDGELNKGQSLFGNVLIILSGVCWVFFVLLAKKWVTSSIKPFHTVVISSYVAAVGFFILSSFQLNSLPTLSPLFSPSIYGILYMAIFGSIIGYTAYNIALKYMPISEADIFSYLSPLWSIPLAVFWLKERFDPALIVSAILIVIGVYMAEKKERLRKDLKPHHLAHHK
jgi:drug/metabolite transporter (DMT)-like permease